MRKLTLNLKDAKQESDRMTNRMRLHDDEAATAKATATAKEVGPGRYCSPRAPPHCLPSWRTL